VVTSVAFSPDGTHLLSGSVNNTVKLWDARTGRLLHTFEGAWMASRGCIPQLHPVDTACRDQPEAVGRNRKWRLPYLSDPRR
jgi:WD40 repeat protein